MKVSNKAETEAGKVTDLLAHEDSNAGEYD
jgi:hypothetical protein